MSELGLASAKTSTPSSVISLIVSQGHLSPAGVGAMADNFISNNICVLEILLIKMDYTFYSENSGLFSTKIG